MQYILLVALLIVIIIVVKYKTQSKSTSANGSKVSLEYNQYYNSIEQMSYAELDKIHNELLPLCNKITFVIIPHADEYGQPVYNSHEENIKKLNDKRREILPLEQQIYGCKTFGDAEKLNQAVVKRLDELDKE
ncbi:MAG: hypothetical protein NC489_33180 [Ruminococcus flavefaciens]|nr:hypothetical protein [Ruminococcus flavefaciens]